MGAATSVWAFFRGRHLWLRARHAISGATVAAVQINGLELGELGLNAALAAHYGAATGLAAGDDTLIREAELVVPGIATVEVNGPRSHAAQSLHPVEGCARIEVSACAILLRSGPGWQAPSI